MTISESATQLPHQQAEQAMILHSFLLYKKLQTQTKKAKKSFEKNQRKLFPALDIFKLWDSLVQDIVDAIFIHAKN